MLLTVQERVWIIYKSYHKTNKIASVALSLFMAYWTLDYKKLAYQYYREELHSNHSPRHANIYNILLWLTFIYFAF